jgi:hypothetical protein
MRFVHALTIVLSVCLTAPAMAQVRTAYSGAVTYVAADDGGSDAVYVFNTVDVSRGRFRATLGLPFLSQQPLLVAVPTAPTPWSGGLGDPTVRAEFAVGPRTGAPRLVTVSALLKIPAASVEAGLGSGEFDGAFGVTIAEWRGRHSWLLDVSYWIVGDSPDVPRRNVPAVYVGYGRLLGSANRWSVTAGLSSSAAITSGLAPPTQATFGVFRALGPRAGIGGSIGVGLTGTAARITAGANWRVVF